MEDMREGVGARSHAAREGGGRAREARREEPPVRLLRDGGDAAEPVGLEGVRRGRSGRVVARDGVEESERLAAETPAELVRDDLDLVVLRRRDVVPVLVLSNSTLSAATPGSLDASWKIWSPVTEMVPTSRSR